MEILFTGELLKALRTKAKSKIFKEEHSYQRTIDSRIIDPADFDMIKKLAGAAPLVENIDNRRIVRQIENIEAIHTGKAKKITNVETLAEAIMHLVAKTPRCWVFKGQSEGPPLPYFVEHVKFKPTERYQPKHVEMKLAAVKRGEAASKTAKFESKNLTGTAIEILTNEGYLLATDKLIADYEADLAVYREIAAATGEQYHAVGIGVADENHWHRNTISFEKDGEPAKVVIDDQFDLSDDEDDDEKDVKHKEEHSGVVSKKFWDKPSTDDDDDDTSIEDESDMVIAPTHPVVRVFSLRDYAFAETHVSNLTRYVYDEKISSKLVLPADHKLLIDTLTSGAITKLSDIVKGKATGIIVLCSGPAGTGKTLTAEVYSEAAKRPLYMVQCSQLGTDEETLEKKLGVVLERATRWKAILLIDEADVYIHERGNDIQQNAIVGVFLRVLEYFNGILFMSTNRATVIDDAIISRMTAHVKYEIPSGDDKRRLWVILAEQYDLWFTSDLKSRVAPKGGASLDIEAAIKEFPNVSGRDMRQLLKLSKIMADRDKEAVTIKHLRWAAKYHDFTGDKP